MSLQETTIISILKGLQDGTMNIDSRWSPYYVNMIKEYFLADPLEGFIKSVSNNMFQLADYFLFMIPDDDRGYILTDSFSKESLYGNIRSMNYLESWADQDMLIEFYNIGLSGATLSQNIELINLFIEKGADDMNQGLISAVKVNSYELINFFIERGADNWQMALLSSIETNNMELVNYFLGLIGDNIEDYMANNLLVKSLHLGNIDLIEFFLNYMVKKSQLNDLVIIGPVLRSLVEKISFKTKSGEDYSDWFPLLRQGYISESYVPFLLKLYIHETKLKIYNQHPLYDKPNTGYRYSAVTFLLDETLKQILFEIPALYNIKRSWIKSESSEDLIMRSDLINNVFGESSMNIIDRKYTKYPHKDKLIAYNLPLTSNNVAVLNTYLPEDIPYDMKIKFQDPEIINQVLREKLLLDMFEFMHS